MLELSPHPSRPRPGLVNRSGHRRLTRLATAGLAVIALGGCVSYRQADLPDRPRPDPASEDLALAAARLERSAPGPVEIDLSRPLSPDQLGLIAVIANPGLRAERARLGVAEAQVFEAGLFPDPQFSFSLDRPASAPGLVDAIAGGLGIDTASLYMRPLRQRAARAASDQVRLDLAWQEWQTAGQARLIAARVRGLETIWRIALEASLAADDALDRTLRAVARGDLSANDLEARRIAAADAGDRARTAERDLFAARFALNAVLGLSPDALVMVEAAPVHGSVPDPAPLVERAYAQRIDLVQQYPRLNLSLNAARDTGAVRTNGVAIGFDLPLWNRNRGAIAVQDATREQLRAEYEARLFTIRSEVTTLIAAYRIGLRQRDALEAQVTPLRQTVEAFERAGARGDIARVTAETARQALTDKEIALAVLDQALSEQWVALELASGALIGEAK